MKKTLKLIPAIAMLLISAVLVSTSTYAWFTMNASVTATGMQVKAKVTGSLYIIEDSGTGVPAYTSIINTSANLSNNPPVALAPTSTVNLNNWYAAIAAAPGSYEKGTGNYNKVSDANLDDYRLVKTAYVRSAADFTSLKVTGLSISYTGTDTYDFNKAVTVAIKCTAVDTNGDAINTMGIGSTVFIANETRASTNNAIEADTTSTGKVGTMTFVPAAVSGMTAEILDASVSGTDPAIANANQVYKVEFFVYFDGMSTSCYTNAVINSVNTAGYTIDATITASGGSFGA